MRKQWIAGVMGVLLSSAVWAQVSVEAPWVRATVAQQPATGAFMRLTAQQDARLVRAASPVAEIVEIHEMALQGDVMRMRAIDALALPAGTPVELKPGGYHVMLINLKQQMQEGDSVPLTLTVVHADGREEQVALEAPVRPLNTRAAQGHGHGHGVQAQGGHSAQSAHHGHHGGQAAPAAAAQ